MAKCRMLIQENQELGRQLSQGRVAQLEAELALQKKYSDELKGSQDGTYNQELGIDCVLPFICRVTRAGGEGRGGVHKYAVFVSDLKALFL